MHIKKGQNVIILTGKDKGKSGEIVAAFPKENKVIVAGRNMMKKHQKPRRQGEKGSIVEVAMPIHASNVRSTDAAVVKTPKAKVEKAPKAEKAVKAPKAKAAKK